MLKKFAKRNPVEKLLIKSPPKLVGGAFFYGKIKAGKTTAMISLAQKYHDLMGYKIFDIYGGQRNENLYWSIPSDQINYWSYIKKKFNIKEEQEGPKQYKVNILYPFFSKRIPKNLPHKPPNVKSKLFTIPIKDIEIEDIRLTVNNVSDSAIYIWRECLEKLKNKDAGPEMEEIIKELKGENQIIYKNLLMPLIKENFLQHKNCPYNLDVKAELKDRETITILCLQHIPSIYHLFIIGWILRQTKVLLDNGKAPKKNIFLLREASEFFRAKDDSVTDNRIKYFRKLLTDYIRYGRRGMHIFADTQSPAETKGICEGSADHTFLGRIPATSREDRAALADALYSVGKITKKQIEQIGSLRPGEFFTIVNAEDAKKRYVFLPRTLFWKEKYKNFESVWRNIVNKWLPTNDDLVIMREDYKKRVKKIEDEKKFKKELKKIELEDEKLEKVGLKEKLKEKTTKIIKKDIINTDTKQEDSNNKDTSDIQYENKGFRGKIK